MRTQVGIVGAGPAGLTLAMLLHRANIDTVVLESRDRAYVEKRVRAGLLEQNTVDLLRDLNVAERLDREGLEHNGIYLRYREENHYVDMTGLTGRHITIYGQQEVVKDLTSALLDRGVPVLFETSDVELHDIETDSPRITYEHDGQTHELTCDAIAGCDGFHGVSRPTIAEHITEYDYVYPFGWLGILAEASPATDELIYAWHAEGFALYTMRSQKISRLYLQVDADEDLANWPDDRIWSELQRAWAASTRATSSTRASPRCVPTSPSRCSAAACSWPATRPTSFRPPAPRASTWRSTMCGSSRRRSPS